MPEKTNDFYDLESRYPSEVLKFRDRIRSHLNENYSQSIADHYEAGTFPKALVKELAKLKALGTTLNGYGCPGLSQLHYGLAMQELEALDSGVRSFASVQSALAMYPIYMFGNENQKKKYLEKMSNGELVGCFGLTEPDHGSNPAGLTTQVKRDGADYILNGHKKWLTNGTMADIAIIWAKDEDQKLNGFIVERESKGVEVREIKKKLSLRVSDSSEYVFNDVRLKAEQRLEVVGFKGPFSCLNQARFGISWGALGAAKACLNEVIEYTKSRSQFGKPLASFQLIQSKISNAYVEIVKGELLASYLTQAIESKNFKPEQISVAKMNNVAAALKIARDCRDILGANGITSDFQTMRHMCNLETVNTYEGTEDIHRLVIGNSLTGLPAFS